MGERMRPAAIWRSLRGRDGVSAHGGTWLPARIIRGLVSLGVVLNTAKACVKAHTQSVERGARNAE